MTTAFLLHKKHDLIERPGLLVTPVTTESVKGIRMDLSRFRAALIAHLSDLSFEGQGAFPAECRMPASRIVEAIDVFKDGDLSVSTCAPGALPQQLSFDRLEEGFHCRVVVAIASPTH